jgi:hypothetical protein
VPNANEQKWKEESKEIWKIYRNGDGHSFGHLEALEMGYLAARKKAQEEIDFKDSQLKTREAVLNKEIERLHKKVTSLHGGYDEAVIIFNGECEKRDKLLEQAMSYVRKYQRVAITVEDISGSYSLLEDYEELKK